MTNEIKTPDQLKKILSDELELLAKDENVSPEDFFQMAEGFYLMFKIYEAKDKLRRLSNELLK